MLDEIIKRFEEDEQIKNIDKLLLLKMYCIIAQIMNKKTHLDIKKDLEKIRGLSGIL